MLKIAQIFKKDAQWSDIFFNIPIFFLRYIDDFVYVQFWNFVTIHGQ